MEVEVGKVEDFPRVGRACSGHGSRTRGQVAMFLHWVLFQGPSNYLLWWELKWAGGVGRGIRNVYEGVGLYGSWGSWRIWRLEWKLVRCFWVLHAYACVMSQCVVSRQ